MLIPWFLKNIASKNTLRQAQDKQKSQKEGRKSDKFLIG